MLCLVAHSLQPHGLLSTRLLCPWDSSGKNTRVGCLSLLQGIFPTQGLNPGSYITSPLLKKKKSAFISLCQVLVTAHEIFGCGMSAVSCGLWNLVPCPGIEHRPPAFEVQSPSHWTTREAPQSVFLLFEQSLLWKLDFKPSLLTSATTLFTSHPY